MKVISKDNKFSSFSIEQKLQLLGDLYQLTNEKYDEKVCNVNRDEELDLEELSKVSAAGMPNIINFFLLVNKLDDEF